MSINERQLKLYNYLLNQEGWVNRKQILMDLSHIYEFVDNGNLYNNAAAILLTRDLHILNNSNDVRKLIIHNSRHGVKIADEKEASVYLNKALAESLKKLQQYHFLHDKLIKDGQATMVDDGIKVLETFRR